MNAEQRKNLLNAARAAEEARSFNQRKYGSCGTPGCVLGSYAERARLQRVFVRKKERSGFFLRDESLNGALDYFDEKVLEHFGLDDDEASELFGPNGCGNAGRSGKKAAAYIRAFVERKDAEARG